MELSQALSSVASTIYGAEISDLRVAANGLGHRRLALGISFRHIHIAFSAQIQFLMNLSIKRIPNGYVVESSTIFVVDRARNFTNYV